MSWIIYKKSLCKSTHKISFVVIILFSSTICKNRFHHHRCRFSSVVVVCLILTAASFPTFKSNCSFGMFCRCRNLSSYVEPKMCLCKMRVICMIRNSALLSHHRCSMLAILFCTDNTPNMVSLTDEDDPSHQRQLVVHSAFRSH